MRDRAAVLIIHDNRILLLWRRRDGQSYYSIPGGKLEKHDDSPARGAAREVLEETGLVVSGLIELDHFEHDERTEYYFFPKRIEGDLENVCFQGEELLKAHPENQYHLEWVSLDRLHRTRLYPPAIRARILEFLRRSQ